MSYAKYHDLIVRKYRVQIMNWPSDVKFGAPGNIGLSIPQAESFLKDLELNIIYFRTLTEADFQVIEVQHRQDVRDGRIEAPATRKRRKDAGKPRGPNKKRGGDTARQDTPANEGDGDDGGSGDGESGGSGDANGDQAMASD